MKATSFSSVIDLRAPIRNGDSTFRPLLLTAEQRRTAVIARVIELYGEWFDSDGRWISSMTPPDPRETIWGVFSLLQGESTDVALANAILHRLEFEHHHPTRTEGEQASLFDIFVTNHTVQLLVEHGEKLEPSVREKLEGWARHALADYPGDRQCDYQFHGCNDNMPAKATLGLILAGEYFGDTAAVEHGLWNLRQLRDLLTRRGLLSEYTSPTYLPLSIVNLTEIARHARHPEARDLAAQCVERVWADAIGHFHSPTGTMGGPYSRAYQLDSTGHFSSMGCLLWIALGDRVALRPLDELSRKSIRLVHHHDSWISQVGVLSWIASCPLEPPAYLVQWLNGRKYPFHLLASAERGFEHSGEVNTTFYAEEDFALGTAEGDGWSELQSEMYFLQFRRNVPLYGIEDLRTVYCRYLINDQRPGDRKEDHMLRSHGIIHTVQDGRVALVLSRPSLSLTETDLHTLKFSIILPEHFAAVEKIEVQDGHVFIQDGPVYLGLRGLNATDLGRKTAVKVEQINHYRIISFFNAEGEIRRFSQEELGLTLNGFVSIVGLRAEETWGDFCERVKKTEVLDYHHNGSRTVRCKVGDTILGMSYSVALNRVRYRTINGRLAPRPEWHADGMPRESLPFFTDPQPNSLELPFEHLRVIWAPKDKWGIASTGHREVRD
ncbi:MAG: hypothetical protein B9S32_09130 [Verrucomicrobia bacterium Tous-C9LFEB]|nr:MAG: hypothetical protein B9S32_09130 [Verrucomicrobia bacterium Tous-C9LFEB]